MKRKEEMDMLMVYIVYNFFVAVQGDKM